MVSSVSDAEKSYIYQAVLKVRSVQSLDKIVKNMNGEEEVVKGPASEPKRKVEYLVLQRQMFKGEESPWKIWGTTEETKVEDALEEQSKTAVPALPN